MNQPHEWTSCTQRLTRLVIYHHLMVISYKKKNIIIKNTVSSIYCYYWYQPNPTKYWDEIFSKYCTPLIAPYFYQDVLSWSGGFMSVCCIQKYLFSSFQVSRPWASVRSCWRRVLRVLHGQFDSTRVFYWWTLPSEMPTNPCWPPVSGHMTSRGLLHSWATTSIISSAWRTGEARDTFTESSVIS